MGASIPYPVVMEAGRVPHDDDGEGVGMLHGWNEALSLHAHRHVKTVDERVAVTVPHDEGGGVGVLRG